jgi:hypothetical protein
MTLLELLIATFITGILVAGLFSFYVTMEHETEIQHDVTEIQHLCRVTIDDIKKSLRMSGYRLDGHDPYKISGDSLSVYFSETQTVDTVLYYLQEFTAAEYSSMTNLPAGTKVCYLMKKRNSQQPGIFADYINDMNFVPIDSVSMAVTVKAQSARPDEKFAENNGYRTHELGARVYMRNLDL